jgi:hypothetical protein
MSRFQITVGLYYLIAYGGPVLIAAIIFGIGEHIALRKQIKRKDTIKKISA